MQRESFRRTGIQMLAVTAAAAVLPMAAPSTAGADRVIVKTCG